MPQVSCAHCSRVLEYGGDRPSFCGYCGQSLDAPPSTVPGLGLRGAETVEFVPAPAGAPAGAPDRVKGYRLIRQLGRGGMGTVYEAEDSRSGRKVALKIIAPGHVETTGAVERFRQEGRLASTLSHPRCVFVLEADEDDEGRPFIAMELMTGDTLQDLVEKGGPLPVGDAVTRILDVVEGLREAHRLGLIHRDVKPSNCFLDADGRVKVGDFGLSKSRDDSARLTRTGSFLGTPLYASPEQIKVEPLDARTDVYSAAATLFFLLTGRAPFDRGDAAATMARIVSDPAPSAREKQPAIPKGLDRAIRKGLERDRDRRHRDLDEFRAALRPFLPGHAPAARLSHRGAAYLFDYLIAFAVLAVPFAFIKDPASRFAGKLPFLLAYFVAGDRLWGGSPGKRLVRLRVVEDGGREPAGFARCAVRALVFLILGELPIALLFFSNETWAGSPIVWTTGCLLLEALGLAALAWPLRSTAIGRPLHDLIAGTTVVGLPSDGRRRMAGARRRIGRERGPSSRPIGVIQAVGPYKIRGAVRWEPNRRVLAGEDSTLGRESWIVLRPRGSPAPGPARRDVARATRPRWLAGGEQAEGRWDAYIAPSGSPLADFSGPEGLSWPDARPILEDLADELAAACADATLPPGLTVDQVWVQPDGRAVLVDPLGIAEGPDGPEAATDQDRALSLLRRVAALALEGGRCHADAIPETIRTPAPLHASAILGRLVGGPDAYRTVDALRADLDATRQLPTRVGRGHRAMHLVVLGLFLGSGLAWCFVAADAIQHGQYDPRPPAGGILQPAELAWSRLWIALALVGIFPATWVVWDLLTRGGSSIRLAGLGLARVDGRKPSRWRCGWRSLLIWSPPVALLVASVWADARHPKAPELGRVFFYSAAATLPIYAGMALLLPSRGLHDGLSGLRIVPK